MNPTVTKQSSVTVSLKGHEITLTEDEVKELRDALLKEFPVTTLRDVFREIQNPRKIGNPWPSFPSFPGKPYPYEIPLKTPEPTKIYCLIP